MSEEFKNKIEQEYGVDYDHFKEQFWIWFDEQPLFWKEKFWNFREDMAETNFYFSEYENKMKRGDYGYYANKRKGT